MAKDALKNMRLLARKLPGLAEQAMQYTMLAAEGHAKRTTAFQDRTGRLRNSIQAGVTHATTTQVTGTATAGANDAAPGRGGDWVTASMEYAPYLELGTSKMSPRPFVWPAIQRVRAEQVLERALKSFLRGAV